ncbi:GIY-YIG nuclease family protein [Neobacillus rhizophilus]|uniref:GIY-YIG nuclease family protein n=1 Tax=Neobacillus rhizophilus TaxID=2833579 RepID=A0A942U6C0_9BACI|nr:GIY-YIG nuclease family protein [Neobacillus rhizophilus]MBS4213236.1 GIY-YIG nuclease family protein [Neobacillus rhizophilus]
MNKKSGLYFFHLKGGLKYVGKTDNFWKRFYSGYLKEESSQHCNPKLMQLVKKVPNDIEVIFKPLAKDELKEEESRFIQEWIPQFNKTENPRYEIRSIQRVIGRIVNETDREWTFSAMREDLIIKWRGEVSVERIDEALANRTGNLSRYCKTNPKKQTLMPKKK